MLLTEYEQTRKEEEREEQARTRLIDELESSNVTWDRKKEIYDLLGWEGMFD